MPSQPQARLQAPAGFPPGQDLPSFELKFLVPEPVAGEVEAWAGANLAARPPAADLRTTILHLDTPSLDIFHRSRGYRRRRFRVRRSGEAPLLVLERKIRRGDRVRRRRVEVPAGDLPRLGGPEGDPGWEGAWFREEAAVLGLRPACRVTYRRTTFLRDAEGEEMRLSLDRDLVAAPASDWGVDPVAGDGRRLGDGVILEVEFPVALPAAFRRLVADLRLVPSGVSKFRRAMAACGAVPAAGEGRPRA